MHAAKALLADAEGRNRTLESLPPGVRMRVVRSSYMGVCVCVSQPLRWRLY